MRDLPYKGSLSRSFFRGYLKNGVLTWNKRRAGCGAGASTAKCEERLAICIWENISDPVHFDGWAGDAPDSGSCDSSTNCQDQNISIIWIFGCPKYKLFNVLLLNAFSNKFMFPFCRF